MKNLIRVPLTFCFMFSLTGCLGGGGGGGSALTPPTLGNEPMTIARVMNGASEEGAVAALADLGTGTKDAVAGGVTIEDSYGGTDFTLEEGSLKISRSGQSVSFEFGAEGNIVTYDNGYLLAKSDSASDFAIAALIADGFEGDPAGSYAEVEWDFDDDGQVDDILEDGELTYPSEMLVMNSSAVDLEYSTFGFWAVSSNWQGTLRDSGAQLDSTNIWYQPFADGVEAQKIAPAADVTFTGQATAMAESPGNSQREDISYFIYGTAELNSGEVDGSALKNASLALRFDDFYDITYNGLNITSAGMIDRNSMPTTAIVDRGANEKGVGLDQTKLIPVGPEPSWQTWTTGQFYGDGVAGEATGTFSAADTTGNYVLGTFGVTKNP